MWQLNRFNLVSKCDIVLVLVRVCTRTHTQTYSHTHKHRKTKFSNRVYRRKV